MLWFVEAALMCQRQEGIGAGNSVRLRERSKALKGEPHERIWPEIVVSRHALCERVKRLRKPVGARRFGGW
jgi:hypothetical protein